MLLHMIRGGIPGREYQPSHRFDHQAAGKGRGKGGRPCLEMACPCCIRFFTRPALSDSTRLNPSRRTGRNQVTQNSRDGGASLYLKTQKPLPSPYNLRIPIGNCIFFQGASARRKFFRAKTPPEEAVGMVGAEVGVIPVIRLF